MSTYPDHTGSGGDTELLAAVAEGDPEAFGTLYDRHASWLMLRLRRRTADLDLVDQIVQDTFLVVWRDAGRFRGSGAVGAWLWGIAIGRLLGRRRAPDAASAEEQALAALEHRDVIRALNRLAPELQAVLQATVLDGLSTREAAALLGIPAGTVKTRAMRARARLREELAGA